MGNLVEDLDLYAHEAYTKRDVAAGLKLVVELAGLGSVLGVAAALTTVTIPFLGPEPSRYVMRALARIFFDKYKDLSAEDRRLVRAAMSIAPSPATALSAFSSRLDELQFFSDVADGAAQLGERVGDIASLLEDESQEDERQDGGST
jgi:hypothetical protein